VKPNLPAVSNKAFEEAWNLLEDIKPVLWGQVETIQRAVIAHFPRVTLNDIKSARRTAIVVEPRQIAMYLAKELTTRSLPDIGRRFGGRDHTTVLHAVRRIAARIKVDPETATLVETIKAQVAELSA
jgi:chromosomal replication initiator protein